MAYRVDERPQYCEGEAHGGGSTAEPNVHPSTDAAERRHDEIADDNVSIVAAITSSYEGVRP